MRAHSGAARRSSLAAELTPSTKRPRVEREEQGYIPALSYRVLTPLYDPVLRRALRGETFRSRLVQQVDPRAGYRVLDLGCGTGSLARRIKAVAPGGQP